MSIKSDRHEEVYVTAVSMETTATARELLKTYFGDYRFGNKIYQIKDSVFKSPIYTGLTAEEKTRKVNSEIANYIEEQTSAIQDSKNVSPESITLLKTLIRSQVKVSITIEDINWGK